jgi:gliding motility-associated-like protein
MIIKKLLILLFSLMIFTCVKSNHLYGGEIQYKLIDTFNGIYEIQLVLNRSCKDYALPITQFVEVKNCTGQTISIPLNLYKKEIMPTACYQGTCDGNQNINIESNFYKTNVLIGKKCGWTSIHYIGQNRAYSSNLKNLETPLFLQALIQTDYINSSASLDFQSMVNPNVLELYIQKYNMDDANKDSVFLEISAPYIAEGSPIFNAQLAELKPTLNSQKPLFIFENQIFKSNNTLAFTPSIIQNSWVNFVLYEYRKIERLNKLDTFVLISKRNVDHLYSISNTSSNIFLHKASSSQSIMHIDSQKMVYCNDFQSPQVEMKFLIPKNRAKESIKWLGSDDIVLSDLKNIFVGNGNFDTLYYFINFKPSQVDKVVDFQLEVSVCESNFSKTKLFTYSIEWFQNKIFEKDTFLNCSATSEVQISLLSAKNIIFNYKKQNIIKQDTSLTMRFLNPKDTMIYAQYMQTNTYCPIMDSIYLNQGDLIEDSIIKTSTSCFGYADAKAKVIVTKGNAPFQYSWNSMLNTSDSIHNLKKGIYTLLITDRDGCAKEEKIEIAEPAGIQYTWVQDLSILCYGATTARGHFIINSSLKPSSYHWNHTAVKDSFLTSMTAGTFSGNLHYTNSLNNPCIQPFQISISQPDSVSFDYIKFDNLCFGASQGKIAISPKGGVGFYLYYIDDVPSIHSLKDDLSNQTYSVKIRDFNNCFSSTKTISINSPSKIATKYQIVKPSCANSNNGFVQISETVGGYGFYEYRLDSNSFSNTQSFYSLPSKDSLKISIRDAYGCSLDTFVSFNGAYQLKIASLKPDRLSCFDSKNGKAMLEFQNGEIPYQVNLQNQIFSLFSKKNILTNLERGTYNIAVVDKNGCKWDSVFTVLAPEEIIVRDSVVKPSCYGYSDAKLFTKISGGNPPYSYYIWNTNPIHNSKDIQNIKSESYIFSFIDSKNCIKTDTIYVPDAPLFKVEIAELAKATCANSNDAILASNIFGGISPFTYVWNQNPIQNQPILNRVQSGRIHQVQVIDSKGCIQIDTQYVANPIGFNFSKINTKSPTCPERKNGFIDFSNQIKDTFTWQYSIDSGKQYWNTSVFNDLGKGKYGLSVKNQMQCIYDTLIEVLPEKSIQFSIPMASDTLNPGQEIALNPIFEFYKMQLSDITSYQWTPMESLSCSDCQNPNAKPFKTTIYSLNIAYANECFSENNVKVNVRKIEDLYIPNIFTPNQDEKNDCWRVFGLNIQKINVQIFDKIGQKVFASNQVDFCWDGTFKGQYCKNDVYFYKIEVVFKDGNSQEYKGPLTLMK